MSINNHSNISSQIATSISKLNLNTAQKTFRAQKNTNEQNITLNEDFRQEDTSLIENDDVKKNLKNQIDVEDIQKYANSMGEQLSIDDINYGLMYGRSVIADYSA